MPTKDRLAVVQMTSDNLFRSAGIGNRKQLLVRVVDRREATRLLRCSARLYNKVRNQQRMKLRAADLDVSSLRSYPLGLHGLSELPQPVFPLPHVRNDHQDRLVLRISSNLSLSATALPSL
jgi:hypothetical protein